MPTLFCLIIYFRLFSYVIIDCRRRCHIDYFFVYDFFLSSRYADAFALSPRRCPPIIISSLSAYAATRYDFDVTCLPCLRHYLFEMPLPYAMPLPHIYAACFDYRHAIAFITIDCFCRQLCSAYAFDISQITPSFMSFA